MRPRSDPCQCHTLVDAPQARRRLHLMASHVSTVSRPKCKFRMPAGNSSSALQPRGMHEEWGGNDIDPHPGASHLDAGEEPRLLSTAQLVNFLVDGVLNISVPTEEFPHSNEVYRRAREGVAEMTEAHGRYNINLANGTPERRFVWADLPQISDLLQAPTVVGALTSLLGPGYSMHPHRALHSNNGNVDQFFHKDGHHIGERDHRPRWIMGLWFPHAVTIVMGPTCVVPGSHYLSVDRERWFDLLPESTREDSRAVLAGGNGASRDVVLETGAATFGGAQRKLKVSANSLVFMHFDLLHRGSRQAFVDVELEDNNSLPFAIDPDIPWRPMVKLQFFRVCEPDRLHVLDNDGTVPTIDLGTATDRPLPSAAVATLRWLRGPVIEPTTAVDNPAVNVTLERQLETAKEELCTPGVEFEPNRIELAYSLGLQAADLGSTNGSGAKAVQVLVDAFESGVEASRRAAQYGLIAAGIVAVPHLTRLIAERLQHLKRQMPLHLQECETDGATTLVRSWLGQLCKLTHSLGEAAAAPTMEVVNQIRQVADEAERISGVHGDGAVCSEARRLRTVSMTALGCLGARAVQKDNAELSALLAQILVECINGGSGDERAAQARAQGAAGAATREAAAQSLLRLTSAPHATATRGSVVDSRCSGRHTHPSFVAAFCADAVRRLDVVVARGVSSTSQRAARQALNQLELTEEEWQDGLALFEEGASRGTMQN